MNEEETEVASGRLVGIYRRYLGEPERMSDVYVGFGLFFAGVTASAVGLAVFLWSTTLDPGMSLYWQLREFAIAAAMLGLPSFLLSVVVLLPVDRRVVVASGLGGTVCLLAVGLFVANYPGNWNVGGADASATGVTVYGLGLVVSTATVGAALVSNYVERVDAITAAEEGSTTETGSSESAVTDEQVRADIEEAVSAADISWGGVEKRETRQITIRTEDADIDRSGFENASVAESRDAGEGVEAAVAGLKKLRGGETAQATGKGTDDQADALRELKERQAREAAQSEGPVLDRIRDRLGL